MSQNYELAKFSLLVSANATTVTIGNVSINSTALAVGGSTVNSSSFPGTAATANNASYLGGTAAANFVANTNGALTQNSSGHFIVANTGTVTNSSGLFVNSSYIATISANNASYLGGTAASGYQTTAGLASNVATLAANSATYVLANSGIVSNSTGVFVNGNTGVVVNTAGVFVNSTYIATISANNASYLGGTVASGYQTTAGLSANVATLSANNASYLGTVAAASYVQNTDSRTLSGNLNFTGVNNYFTNIYVGANNYMNVTTHFLGNSTVNTNISAGSISVNGAVIANNSGVYATGTVNAASHTTSFATVNATTIAAGANNFMNATHHFISTNSTMNVVMTANQITLNGANVITTTTVVKIYYANGTQAYP